MESRFQGDGTILVHECELRGWPGHEQFWLKYTWMNTTGRTVDGARITITLRDQASGAEQCEEMDLSLPLLYRLGPNSSYTTNILIPLRGMRSPPALEWTIRPLAAYAGAPSYFDPPANSSTVSPLSRISFLSVPGASSR